MLEEDARPEQKPTSEPELRIELVSAQPSSAKSTVPVIDPLPPQLAVAGPSRPIPSAIEASSHGSGDRGNQPSSGAGNVAGSTLSSSLFASPARARSVVYVIDRSVSMGLNGALEQVKRELLASLARLPSDMRFQIILYNRSAQPLVLGGAAGMACATDANRAAVAQQLESLQAEGGTEHLPALSLALSYQADVIYFLTDADDLRPEQVRQVTQMNRGRAAIHTIELTTANANRLDMPLQALARENRGTYRAVTLR
jgi:Ca-activated chloride channel family protein